MNLDIRLLHLIRKHPQALLLTVGLGFLGGILTILQAGVLSRVINQVFLENQASSQVRVLVGLLLVIILGRAGLLWGSEVSANALATWIKARLRQQFYQRLLSLGPARTRYENTGELVSTAIEGIEALDAYFSQYLPQLALAALVPLTILAFVFPIDPLSGLVLLVTAPLIPLFMILIGNLSQALTRRQWQNLSRMGAYFLDVLQGLTTLKLLGRSRHQVQSIAQASDRFRQITLQVLRVTFLSALVLEWVATLSTAVVAVEVGLRLLYNRLAFEQAFFILILAPEFYLPLRLLGMRFHAGMSGTAAAKRIFEVLDSTANDGQSSVGNERLEKGLWSVVTFEDVRYTYPGDRHALHGASFTIAAGQKVALVGSSGAGKSTIASLLLRFIEPAQGQVMIDGKPLAEIPADEWLRQVAWVSQTPYLFNDSVAANIRLSRPDATQEQVIQAARQANAHEFIQELPDGYDTLIGERGARLSGGQAQRIALARAFLKDAPLVILDEATANLDPQSEELILQALDRLLVGRTALVIAHRLNTISQVDQIIVLEGGRVVESGDHASLMAKGGLYRRLVTTPVTEPPTSGNADPPVGGPPPDTEIQADLGRVKEIAEVIGSPKKQPSPFTLHFSTAFQTFFRLLQFVSPFTGLVALSALLGFATVGSSIGLMATSAYLISAAALHPSIAALQVAIVGVRFFGLARGVFRYLERLVSHQVTFRLLARLRVWFYQSLEPLAPARLMQFRSGDLLARILGDIESLENFYVRALAPPLVAAMIALGMGLFMGRYHPSLALVLLSFLFAGGLGVPLLSRMLGNRAGQEMVDRRAALNACLVEGIQGLADLLAFGQGQRQAEKIERLGSGLVDAQLRMARASGIQSALSNLVGNLAMWTVLALAIPLVQQGQIEGVFLAGLALGTLASFEASQPLPLAAQYLGSNLQAARRLFEIVDARPEVIDPKTTEVVTTSPHHYDLEIRNLRFRYPILTPNRGEEPSIPDPLSPPLKDQPDALDGLSFNLPQGKRLALVGPSGAGKSTVMNLLLRFWEYSEGEILLGGNDLRRYRQDDLRNMLGVVPQSTYLFSATIRENLLMARPNATETELIRAAEQAHIHAFIESLPQGYDTWVGEQGLLLSGGERQRLSLARALLTGAPILLLDEPTANLDALTEREVLHSLFQAMEGRSILVATHRLVEMVRMDEILVMDGGRVIERGAHRELLKAGGFYRKMWEIQRGTLNV